MEFRLMVISAVITLVCTMPFMVSAGKRGAYRGKKEMMIEEAKSAGRTAVGRLVSKRFLPGEPGNKNPLDRDDRWLGTYSFEVNGKTYTCGVGTTEDLPETLTVYYPAGRPDKAVTEMNVLIDGKPVIYTMIPVILWAVVYWLLVALT